MVTILQLVGEGKGLALERWKASEKGTIRE